MNKLKLVWHSMKQLILVTSIAVLVLFGIQSSPGQVVLVEGSHTLTQLVDSSVTLDPSQAILDDRASIESIGVDPSTGDLYIQLAEHASIPIPFAEKSDTTHIYRVTPAGVVSPVVLDTGFGINSRGTDLHFDPVTGLLVTQDQNFAGGGRLATVVPGTGVIGTWAPFVFALNTFGMDFSAGIGGADVPATEIVFTSDRGGGMNSAPFGGPVTPHSPLPSGGDDIVIQPDGEWVHVGDFDVPLTAYSPAGPEDHATVTSPLNILDIFTSAGLPFIYGSRATVCDSTGELYISYSGVFGGSGIFRVDEPLETATLLLTIGLGRPLERLQDLIIGPSTSGGGKSVFFTVHEEVFGAAGNEQVWELTVPECPAAAEAIDGRMSGGGSVFTPAGVRFTHGFQLHCDVADSPNNLQVNWPKDSGKGSNRFHLESLTSTSCSDDPAISEGKPAAGFDTYAGSGMGRLNGVSGAMIDFEFTDAGEPGKGVDKADITITPLGGAPIAVSGTLEKGNHQAHAPR